MHLIHDEKIKNSSDLKSCISKSFFKNSFYFLFFIHTYILDIYLDI